MRLSSLLFFSVILLIFLAHFTLHCFNTQEMATRFIDRLSDEFTEYLDIIQLIQLAVYEMKLGLSLVLSSLCFTGTVEPYNGKRVMVFYFSICFYL